MLLIAQRLCRTTFLVSMTLAATPSAAAENLSCMDSGYSVADKKALATFFDEFTLEAWNEGGALQQNVAPAVMGHARACGAANGWSSDAIMQAFIYKGVELMIKGLDAKGTLTATQTEKLRIAYQQPEGQKLPLCLEKLKRARPMAPKAAGSRAMWQPAWSNG